MQCSSFNISWLPKEKCLQEMKKILSHGGIDNFHQEAIWMRQELERRHSPEKLDEWLQRRLNGEPFQYILGSTEFFGLEFRVGPGVLIPRPETELLVEEALTFYKSFSANNPAVPFSCCDLCTGSGAIALSIAHELPFSQVLGIDISPDALQWAECNKKALNIPNAFFFLGDLFTPIEKTNQSFAIITANPPYVSPDEYQDLPSVVKNYEPRLALYAENRGLAIIQKIAENAGHFLLPQGMLIMEIGYEQGPETTSILTQTGFSNIRIVKDYAGLDRFCVGFR